MDVNRIGKAQGRDRGAVVDTLAAFARRFLIAPGGEPLGTVARQTKKALAGEIRRLVHHRVEHRPAVGRLLHHHESQIGNSRYKLSVDSGTTTNLKSATPDTSCRSTPAL
jgi:hypothetical protein